MANSTANSTTTAQVLAATSLPANNHWRGWTIVILQAMATGLAVGLCLLALVVTTAATAQAQTQTQTNAATDTRGEEPIGESLPEEFQHLPRNDSIPEGAALMFRTDHGLIAAPLQSTNVVMRVSGHVVRTRVSQTYHNPSDAWLNATYRFPMPDGSAVDGLVMRVGETIIRGEIKEKEVAKRAFELAKREGKRASLVSQSKPNDFTARVANISPRGDISIEIEYQQVLRLGPDGWALRFPTVVAPRYKPQARPQIALTPVVYGGKHEQQSDLNRIQLRVEMNAGIPVTVPRSLTHQVSVTPNDEEQGNYTISLTTADIANRDFELQWEPRAGKQPAASIQFEEFDGQWYGLVVVAPPDPDAIAPLTQPREVIFVIDTSGSMHGDSIDQAVESLHFGLRRLNPKDRFNIIRFSNESSALFNSSLRASSENLDRARNFVDNLEANGGTEMNGAIERALRPSIPAGYISQVIFVTDGAVGAEQALFNTIENLLGNRRFFTVGIGTAPNGYFMKKAAAAGRGSFTMIGSTRQVKTRMTRLFEKLAFPMLANLQLRNVNGEIIKTDTPIRDLYAGEPMIHSFRVDRKPDALFLEGTRDQEPWQQEMRIHASTNTGVHRLWARDTLDGFSAQIRRADLNTERRNELRAGATQLALKHGLVSQYTSLVAVDQTPVRPENETATDTAVPRHLPKGFSARHTVSTTGGQLAQGSTGLWLQMLFGGLLLFLSVAFGALFLTRAEKLVGDEGQS
jgi:Ca-activated chloride channel family protein